MLCRCPVSQGIDREGSRLGQFRIVLVGGLAGREREPAMLGNVRICLAKVTWRKAVASNAGGGCVELADLGVAMRDSKDPYGPCLFFTRAEIAAFLLGVRYGEFDHLA